MVERFTRAPHPFSWIHTWPLCLFIAETITSMPPRDAIFTLFSENEQRKKIPQKQDSKHKRKRSLQICILTISVVINKACLKTQESCFTDWRQGWALKWRMHLAIKLKEKQPVSLIQRKRKFTLECNAGTEERGQSHLYQVRQGKIDSWYEWV